MAPVALLLSLLGTYVVAQRSPISSYALIACVWILLFILSCFARLGWNIFVYPRYSPFRHLPAPDQGPLLKRLMREPFASDHAIWINEVPNEGLIRYHGFFNGERLLVTHPDGLKDVLTLQQYHYIKQPFAVKLSQRVAGLGLVAANQDEHKFQRKLFQPIFKFANIKELYPVFWEESVRFVDVLERRLLKAPDCKDGQTSLEILSWVSAATMDIFARTAFGGSYNALEDPDSKLMHNYKLLSGNQEFNSYFIWAMLLPYKVWRYLPMQKRYQLDQTLKETRDAIKPFINPRLHNSSSSIGAVVSDTKHGVKFDIMARILESGHQFTEEQLIDHVFTFLIAGHDTTSAAVCFTLYMLSKHPEAQSKLRAEIRSKLPPPQRTGQSQDPKQPNLDGATTSTIDASLLDSLTYLAATVHEGIRLHAPVPHVRREVYKPGAKILGRSIPVGTTVSTSPWAINRSKALWGDSAHEFRPERWINKETGKIDWLGGATSPYACNSFGHGPRACIGEKYGRAETASLLACLVGRFEWTYKGAGEHAEMKDPIFVPQVFVKIKGGLWLNFKRVEGW